MNHPSPRLILAVVCIVLGVLVLLGVGDALVLLGVGLICAGLAAVTTL